MLLSGCVRCTRRGKAQEVAGDREACRMQWSIAVGGGGVAQGLELSGGQGIVAGLGGEEAVVECTNEPIWSAKNPELVVLRKICSAAGHAVQQLQRWLGSCAGQHQITGKVDDPRNALHRAFSPLIDADVRLQLDLKVGIAFNPAHRWRNDDFGYVHEKMWMFMDVMHSGSANECRSLEKDLIQSVRRLPGCYNTRPGGEGVRSATPGTCYCYAVYAPAGSGVGVHAAWRQREDWVTGANDCSCT